MNWMEAEQRLKAVKEGLLIVALVLGGAWAVYRFAVLESAAARLAYDKALSDSKAFGIQVDIDATSYVDGACKVFGNIKLQNVGSILMAVELEREPPIDLAAVALSSDGHSIDPGTQRRFWIDDSDRRPARNVAVVPGRTVTLPFAAEVEKPGLYMIRFRAPVHFQGGDGKNANSWTERKIFRACAPDAPTAPTREVRQF